MIKINSTRFNNNDYENIKKEVLKKAKKEVMKMKKENFLEFRKILSVLKKTPNTSMSIFIKDIIEYDQEVTYYSDNYNFIEYIEISILYEEAKTLFKKRLSNGENKRKLFLEKIINYIENEKDNILNMRRYLIYRNNINKDLILYISNERYQFISFVNTIFRSLIDINTVISPILNYELLIKTVRNRLIKSMDIRGCPYCNQIPIELDITKVTADLDHFYPQAAMPLFAATFNNFIPSCPSCNRTFKGSYIKEISNPRIEGFGDIAKFKIKFHENHSRQIYSVDDEELLSYVHFKKVNDLEVYINYEGSSNETNKIIESVNLFDINGKYNNISTKQDVARFIESLHRDFNRNRLSNLNTMLGDEIKINEDDILSNILKYDVRGDGINNLKSKLYVDIIHDLTDWR